MKKDCKYCKHAIPHGKSGHEWECTAEEFDPTNLTCFSREQEDKTQTPRRKRYPWSRNTKHSGTACTKDG